MERNQMKIFLRHPDSGRFYAGSGAWVDSAARAKEFENIIDAIQTASEAFDSVEVLHSFEDPEQNFAYRISYAPRPGAVAASRT